MNRPLSVCLAFSLLLAVGCGEVEDDFGRGGTRAPEAPTLPVWGSDNCGVPGAPGSPWGGLIALDWSLEDPFEREVRLHQFCGRVIILESIPEDSPDLESRLQELETLRSSFSWWELAVVVLIAGSDGSAAEQERLAQLTFDLELGFPLLSDPDWFVTRRYTEVAPTGRSIQLYSPGLVLEATELSEVDASDVDALLPQGGVS